MSADPIYHGSGLMDGHTPQRHSLPRCPECGTRGRIIDEGEVATCQSCGYAQEAGHSVSAMDRVWAECAGEDNRGRRRS